MTGGLEGNVSIPAHPGFALNVIVIEVAGKRVLCNERGFYSRIVLPAGIHTISCKRIFFNPIYHAARIVDNAKTVVNFVWTNKIGYGRTVSQPLPPLPPVLPPLPPLPHLKPPFGKIERAIIPDRICHDTSIPVLAVVRNTGEMEGDFTLGLENTETKEVLTETFSLGPGAEKSVRLATVVPRRGTDLKISTSHAETADDSRLVHAEPTIFGFASIRRFSPPTDMRPGKKFDVEVEVANDGECRDEFLTLIRDTVTGEEILRETSFLAPGESVVWSYPATMVGRFWDLNAEAHKRGVEAWEYTDSLSFTITPVECIIFDAGAGFCEFRGPMAAYIGSIIGSGIKLIGPEKKEEKAVVMPGARFASFVGRAGRGVVDRIEFTNLSDIRARTEIGIATVINRAVTNLNTKEFKYSTIIPRPLFSGLGRILKR